MKTHKEEAIRLKRDEIAKVEAGDDTLRDFVKQATSAIMNFNQV